MLVSDLLITCSNVDVTSNIKIINKDFEEFYRGTYVELVMSGNNILSANVDMFLIKENCDEIVIYLKKGDKKCY